jgi:hypothetical protein
VTHSASSSASKRLTEAGLAGAILGFLQGFLFWIIAPRIGEIRPDEMANMVLLGVIMVVGGVVAGAALALFTGYLVERRRRAQS